MIQIDLTPDVKQELLKAERIRNQVISISTLSIFILAGLLIASGLFVYAVQPAYLKVQNDNITKQSQKLSSFDDINKLVTIQNQLTKINQLHDGKHISSRLLDMLVTINPSDPNKVSYTGVTLDTDNTLVTIEGQANGGFAALDAFKKTIDQTKIEYSTGDDQDAKDQQTTKTALASNVTWGDTNYGEGADGQRVLRFKLSYTYPEELFASTSKNLKIIGPERTNATDSYIGLPQSLFSEKAKDAEAQTNKKEGGR